VLSINLKPGGENHKVLKKIMGVLYEFDSPQQKSPLQDLLDPSLSKLLTGTAASSQEVCKLREMHNIRKSLLQSWYRVKPAIMTGNAHIGKCPLIFLFCQISLFFASCCYEIKV
jgi:hypothetical protein